MSIQDLLDKSLVKKEDRVRSGCFSPSSFGKCFRNQYWNRLNVPQTNPPDKLSLRRFKVGDIFHEFIQKQLVSDNPSIQVEVEVMNKEKDVFGRADIVDTDEVSDIKSTHSKSFWYLQKKDCDIKKEKYNNWLQLGFYAIELQKKFMRLVLVSKDDLCIGEYRLEVDDYWRGEVAKELETLRSFWEKKTLPPALPRADWKTKDGKIKECEEYCAFRDLCYKTEKENVG